MAQIYVDATFFIQIGLFLFLLLVLSQLFFKPLLTMYDRREKLVSDPSANAQRLTREADEKTAAYRARLAAGIEKAEDAKTEAARQAGAAEKEILHAARSENERFLAEARREIGEAKDRALGELRGEADGFADQLVQTLLGKAGR
jgi:F-type H+-transporting ATPase subunit b